MLFSLSRSHLFFPFLSLKSSHSFLLCRWNGAGVYLTSVSSFLCALNKPNLLESSGLCSWIAFTRYLSYHVFKIPGINDFETFTLPTNYIPFYAFSNVMHVLTTWNLIETMMLEEVRGGPGFSISSMFWDGVAAPSWESMLSLAEAEVPSWEAMLSVARCVTHWAKHSTWGTLAAMDNAGTWTQETFPGAWAPNHVTPLMSSSTLSASSYQRGTDAIAWVIFDL